MAAPDKVLALIKRFDYNLSSYRSGKYNETQVRREFIDPFFEELGWDVSNKNDYAEAYKDVIHEDAIKIGGKTKAPDYSFRIGGTRKFFLEAKKPSVNIKQDIHPAFQLRRYAWSAKLPLSILTDFEELAVYDCRIQPEPTDHAKVARLSYFNYREYAERWDELARVFSPEAIRKGSFDKYATDSKNKRGTAEVDDAFLKEIEGWRELLAQNIALRNPTLTQRELNTAVQKTIDRIIFLRICEDRGIEPYGILGDVADGKNIYGRLGDIFQRADDRYNSGLFHFKQEKNRAEEPDGFTLGLSIDDKPLKEILKGLYYPVSPYEFSVLPADILGQVYEQFLGKVIVLDAKHKATVEEKLEVKKAGGVYYTPTYIVDYIVQNTVGKLLEGKTPNQIAAQGKTPPLRVIDPACGSGSFLIGAYQHLLAWHLTWYSENDPEKYAKGRSPRLYQGKAQTWRLTTDERKRILLTHIYGVDIDAQAVEVTKLSLLLKMLEGENNDSLVTQTALFQTRVLPDLDSNIKSGNSLIGSAFYDNVQINLFDEEERYRINVFDWEDEFAQVFVDGGFDAVIGNPPYIRIQALKEFAPKEVEFYKTKYQAAGKGNYDIYVVFVEKGASLLSNRGRLGYILPSKFLTTDYGEAIRSIIAEQKIAETIIDFGHAQVFRNATTYTCLLFLSDTSANPLQYKKIDPQELATSEIAFDHILQESLKGKTWRLGNTAEIDLQAKLEENSVNLLELPAQMSRGTSTGADDVFCLNWEHGMLTSRAGATVEIEPEILLQPIYATDYTRYRFRPKNRERIIFPYKVSEDSYTALGEGELATLYPKAYKYLTDNRRALEKRKQFKNWFGYSAPRGLHLHVNADILVPLLADRGLFAPTPTTSNSYCMMASAGFSISLEDSSLTPYVLGVLNSKLSFWKLQQISNKFRGGWITCTKQYFGVLPVKVLEREGSKIRDIQDRIAELVGELVSVNEKLAATRIAQDKKFLDRQVKTADSQIDQLVYKLYDLKPEEISLIEK